MHVQVRRDLIEQALAHILRIAALLLVFLRDEAHVWSESLAVVRQVSLACLCELVTTAVGPLRLDLLSGPVRGFEQ